MTVHTKSHGSLLWGITLGLAVAIALSSSIIWPTPTRIRFMYAEWAAMEVIVTAHEKSGRVPASWEDLEPWYKTSNPVPRSGIEWDQLRDNVAIHFHQLQLLAASPNDWHQSPRNKIIVPHVSLKMHWIHPERDLARHFASLPQPHSSH